MPSPNPQRVARAFIKTAGEVRFIKDNSGDASQWAYSLHGPSAREITPDYAFQPRNVKQLAKVLWATSAALGHTMTAYTSFAKLKSSDVSPDGSLGGRGYIQKIADMRRQYMNCVEALSALSDTLYDEVRAPHWAAISRQESPEEKVEVQQIVNDAENIRRDPESWAEGEMEEDIGEDPKKDMVMKTANKHHKVAADFMAHRLVNRHMAAIKDRQRRDIILNEIRRFAQTKDFKVVKDFDVIDDIVYGKQPPAAKAYIVTSWNAETYQIMPVHMVFYVYALPQDMDYVLASIQALKVVLKRLGDANGWAGAISSSGSRSSQPDNANGNWALPRVIFSFYPDGFKR